MNFNMHLLAATRTGPTFPIWPTSRRESAIEQSHFSDLAIAMLFVVLGLAALFIAMGLVRRISEAGTGPASSKARALFTRSLKRLGVTWTTRQVLVRAARSSGLAHPTAMLLSKELYTRHALGWSDQIALRSLRNPLRRRIESLGRQLFPEVPAP